MHVQTVCTRPLLGGRGLRMRLQADLVMPDSATAEQFKLHLYNMVGDFRKEIYSFFFKASHITSGKKMVT